MRRIRSQSARWGLPAAALLAAASVISGAQDHSEAEPVLPRYEATRAHAGEIFCVGSTTVGALLSTWRDAYRAFQADVTVELTGGGSGTAPPALTSGSAALAPMSRPMNDNEIAAFRARFGYDPTPVVVAIDALAVYVNIDNPIEALTLEQIDSIFSAERWRGGPLVRTWGDLGLTGEWANIPISLYGLRSDAGGYALFKELALDGGTYRIDMNTEPGSSSIVNAVGAYRGGVGFASQYFQTKRTRLVPIVDENGALQSPEMIACETGAYPLARELYIYVNKPPNQPLEPRVEDFLMFILSQDGQRLIADSGSFPLSAALSAEQRATFAPHRVSTPAQ